MTIEVEPYRADERPRCANCGKPLSPRWPDMDRMMACEEEAYRTNRRVVVRRVEKAWKVAEGDFRHGKDPPYDYPDAKLVPWRVTLTFFQGDRNGWGYDGVFCTLRCALAFAHAALQAGFRRKGKMA